MALFFWLGAASCSRDTENAGQPLPEAKKAPQAQVQPQKQNQDQKLIYDYFPLPEGVKIDGYTAAETAAKATGGKAVMALSLNEDKTYYYSILVRMPEDKWMKVIVNAADGKIMKKIPSKICSNLEHKIFIDHFADLFRDGQRFPEIVMKSSKFKPGEVVADVGCGSGYFTFPIAREVGPKGRVYGVDIDDDAIQIMKERLAEKSCFGDRYKNVEIVKSQIYDICLPENSIATAFICDCELIHEKTGDGDKCFESIAKALKPGGRLIMLSFIDYQLEVMGFKSEKENREHFEKKLKPLGLELIEAGNPLPNPNNFFYIFKKTVK